MKICTKCKKSLPTSSFKFHKNGKNQLHSICKNCECIKQRSYYKINKKDILLKAKNNFVLKKQAKLRHYICQDEWIQYFKIKYGSVPSCEVCGKTLEWRSDHISKSVHFDHRLNGLEVWKSAPKHFWRNRKCNNENIKIWESCNFGILCKICNGRIPTLNRLEWLNKALKYAEEIK